MNTRLSLVAAAAVLALTGLGCQNPMDAMQDKLTEKIGEKIAEKTIEGATGGKVDLKKNSATFKDEKTGDYQSYGEDVEIPADFPSDLKKLDGATVTHVSAKGDKSSAAIVQMVSDTDMTKVADTADVALKANGYTRASDANLGGTIVRSYEKDKNQITVMVVRDTEDAEAKTMVTMTLSVESGE
jgi:hypothetical protein